MKKIVLGCLLLIVGCSENKSSDLKKEWVSSKNKLSIPESAVFDKKSKAIYVSNVNSIKSSNPWVDNNGYISKLNIKGDVLKLKWVGKLQAPKGLAIYKNYLFVSDLNQVVKIDIANGKIVNRFLAPKGINKLNDITCSPIKKACFVSDSGTKKVFEVSVDGKFKLIYDREKSSNAEQNGLFLDGNFLIMQGEVGKLKSLNLNTKKVSIISNNLGIAIDGITKYKNRGYLVSTWSGGVYFINKTGDSKKILGDKFNTADISYSNVLDLLLVPNFSHNIIAYRVLLK